MKKISSYQKLKKRLEATIAYNEKLLNDPEFYIKEVLTSKVSKEINNQFLLGGSEPVGYLNLDHTL